MFQQKVMVIAEAGVNHNGTLQLAKALIDVAVEAKADAVKFQTFKTEHVVTAAAPKAQYQIINTKDSGSQYDMIKALELSQQDFLILSEYCRKKDILFLSTPFDHDSLHFLLNDVHMPVIKIASGEVTNGPLLLAAAKSQKPIILSTGMCHLADIEAALGVLAFAYLDEKSPINERAFQKAYHSYEGQTILREKVSLLHCTSQYPTPFEQANLRAIQTLAHTFGLKVGYSDHTLGIEASIAAVALGARIIEKHFTTSKELAGPDHQASLSPEELKSLVTAIRYVEEALGNGIKKPMSSEIETSDIVRRSLVAKRPIQAGECFSAENLTAKRPASGISPMKYWDYLNKKASKDYQQDETIF